LRMAMRTTTLARLGEQSNEEHKLIDLVLKDVPTCSIFRRGSTQMYFGSKELTAALVYEALSSNILK
jgi:hypothetical protein